jgi:hypothetical protein
MPRAGRAHTTGVSAASFEVLPGGRVEGRLTFATAEALSGIHLDRNRDGVIDATDVAAAAPDLERFVLDGVDVVAGGTTCAPAFEGAAIDEIDGLVLRAIYRCPDDAADVAVTFYYLSGLPAGHRQVARISAGERTTQATLSGSDRAIDLTLPAPPARHRAGLIVLLAAGVLAILAIAAIVARRRRATS